MGQIIIIEDNRGLATLLSSNLKKFTNIEPLPRENADDAIDLLNILPDIELIISKNKIGNEETAKKLAEYISSNNLSTDLVINGQVDQSIGSKAFVVEKDGDYEQILYWSFKALNIPIEEIRKKVQREFIPIKSSLFNYLTFIPNDTYLKLKRPDQTDYFLKCFHQGSKDSSSKIQSYISQNVPFFYILKDDELFFFNILSDSFTQILERSDLTLKERLDTMDAAYEVFSNLIVKWGLFSCITQIYEDMIASTRLIFENHHFVPKVYEAVNKENYSYNFKNFINLSGTFFQLGKENFMDLEKDEEKLAGAALFHDVRLNDHQALIFSLADLRKENLTEIQEEIILDHARDASELLHGELNFPSGMDKIIREHHGDIRGQGFPLVPGSEIGPLSKIFLVCERFLKELHETKGQPDMEKIRKGLTDEISKKLNDRLFFIFSGGKGP